MDTTVALLKAQHCSHPHVCFPRPQDSSASFSLDLLLPLSLRFPFTLSFRVGFNLPAALKLTAQSYFHWAPGTVLRIFKGMKMSSSAIDPCRKIHVRKLHNFSNHHKCWTVFQIWQIGHGQEVTLVIGLGCGVRQTWIQIPPLPWTSCVIWTNDLPSLALCSFIQAAR